MRFVHVCASKSMDSTNHRLCSTTVPTIKKKSACKWTCTIQTPVVEGSTILYDLTCMWNLNKSKLTDTESTVVVERAWAMWEVGRYWSKDISF